jgi:protein SCO1
MRASRMPKPLGIVLALAIGAGAIVGSMLWSGHTRNARHLSGQPQVAHFELADTHEQTVSDRTLRSHPYAIFFGYTRCPDICPITLTKLVNARRALGASAQGLSLVFVGLDSIADTPENLSRYLSAFDTLLIGLSGTSQQIASAAAAFGVKYQRVPGSAQGDFTIAHTGTVFLVNREGRLADSIGTREPNEMLREKLGRLVRQ